MSAQQEPDALARLVQHLRRCGMSQVNEMMALTLISEAREEQRKAAVCAKNEGLDEAAVECGYAAQTGTTEDIKMTGRALAREIRSKREAP